MVLETEANLTRLIKKVFPTTKVFSVLGNHDYFPADHMPVEKDIVRKTIANIWQQWMSNEQANLFEKGVSLLDRPDFLSFLCVFLQ